MAAAGGKVLNIAKVALKILAALACLYFFICSLSFLSTSFRLLAGRHTGKVFSKSELLSNPIVGVMIGVLATVLVQSSSTTTSIIIGMVASGILQVQQAIYMVMGANIGTSVTNTIVSITQIGDREEFERAFACAVVHDIFNWLGVILLLPVEVLTGYLYHITSAMLSGVHFEKGDKPPDFLKSITKPFTNLIIQIDSKVLEGWSLGESEFDNVTTLLKAKCHHNVSDLAPPIAAGAVAPAPAPAPAEKGEAYQCGYLFAGWGLSDTWVGLILLVVSLALLCTCLIILVKLLNSMMQDKMAGLIKRVLNADIPYVPWLTGYLAILVGAVITFLVQSSSVFTSTLTPLCGTGLFKLERAYPLTLGSNIGTTTTGLLAAFASDADRLHNALQIALCHLVFNITTILVFYPTPFMRWPLPMAHAMGRVVAKYRWFAIFYLFFMFFLFPLYIFGLSLLGPIAIYIGFIPLFLTLVIVVIINVIQKKKPAILPKKLHDWSFLPKWMRSLEPYDRLLSRAAFCNRFRSDDNQEETQGTKKNKSNDLEMQNEQGSNYGSTEPATTHM